MLLKNLITTLRVGAPVKPSFFAFSKMQIFLRFTCLQKKACFDVIYTCKATSLSKMAKLVWRYSYDARATIENVYKLCVPGRVAQSVTCLATDACLTYIRCGVNRSADGETRCSPQQDQIPSQGQGVERDR